MRRILASHHPASLRYTRTAHPAQPVLDAFDASPRHRGRRPQPEAELLAEIRQTIAGPADLWLSPGARAAPATPSATRRRGGQRAPALYAGYGRSHRTDLAGLGGGQTYELKALRAARGKIINPLLKSAAPPGFSQGRRLAAGLVSGDGGRGLAAAAPYAHSFRHLPLSYCSRHPGG
jgi:hypothetical protein